MGAEITGDLTEFNKTLKQVANILGKEGSRVVNFNAIGVVRNTIKETPKTKKGRITSDMKKQVIYGGRKMPRAEMLVRRAANYPLPKAEVDLRIQELKTAKYRSIGFIRSGWLPALQDLNRAMGRNFVPRALRGKRKGKAIGATPRKKEAVIENHIRPAQKIGGPALKAGLKRQEIFMKSQIERAFDREFKRKQINGR